MTIYDVVMCWIDYEIVTFTPLSGLRESKAKMFCIAMLNLLASVYGGSFVLYIEFIGHGTSGQRQSVVTCVMDFALATSRSKAKGGGESQ
jgi:hypothetical protein